MSIFIDISHIARWSGRLSGIERVEYHIIKHYINSNARFVCWSDKKKSLVEVARKDVDAFIEQIRNNQQHASIGVDSGNKKIFINKIFNKINLKSKFTLSIFSKGDTMVVLDGLWDNEGYINYLVDASQIADIHHIVYDMIPVVRSGYVLDFMTDVFRNYMSRVLPICKRIYSISNNTAIDTSQFLRDINAIKLPEIVTFRLGDDIEPLVEKVKPSELNKYKKDYVLSVGTVEVRKNYDIFLSVYGLAREAGVKLPHLYIVGKKGWLADDFMYVVSNDGYFKENITVLDNAGDYELSFLYKNAKYVICPSHYEGWGLPVAESLARGKVTLCAKGSSLDEVGGRYADYFSSYNPMELFELMISYDDRSKISKKENIILENYKSVPWEEACNKFAKLVSTELQSGNS